MLPLAWLLDRYVLIPLAGPDEIYRAARYTLFIIPPFIIPLSIIGECDEKDQILDFISLHRLVTLALFGGLMVVLPRI